MKISLAIILLLLTTSCNLPGSCSDKTDANLRHMIMKEIDLNSTISDSIEKGDYSLVVTDDSELTYATDILMEVKVFNGADHLVRTYRIFDDCEIVEMVSVG